MGYVLNNPDIFHKQPLIKELMGRILGNGVIVADGHDHKRQRRVLVPAFSTKEIKDHHTPVIWKKSLEVIGRVLVE
jgi:cytochrome P450